MKATLFYLGHQTDAWTLGLRVGVVVTAVLLVWRGLYPARLNCFLDEGIGGNPFLQRFIALLSALLPAPLLCSLTLPC